MLRDNDRIGPESSTGAVPTTSMTVEAFCRWAVCYPNSAIDLTLESLMEEEGASLSGSDAPALAVGKLMSGRQKTNHNVSRGGPSRHRDFPCLAGDAQRSAHSYHRGTWIQGCSPAVDGR